MNETRHYNAAIVGSGQGGNPLAVAMAAAGHRTALIERKHVGGTCVNEGCTPTKTMVASARVAHLARRASEYGVLMELEEIPEHLLVLGGGYVGLEFAQMYRRFGSAVTVVQRGRQLLPREDADVAEAVADILRKDGIEVLLNADVLRTGRTQDGEIRLAVRVPKGGRVLQGSHLLVATGRTPNTNRLNLDAAGVKTNRRGLSR
jgi:pyruvate/2-oxoglutarate dehydrogenase complex dihydrolipoamide dehydrogenase (E3) component